MATEGRRVLLVIDSSTRRVVSTRPLRPASLDADAMLAEYMAYQSLVRIKEPLMPGIAHTRHVVWPQVTSARDQPASEPFLLRTHGESNEVGGVHAFTGGMATHTPACVHHGARYALAGRYMYVELLDAPGFGPGPVVEQKSTSPASRGRSDPLLL